MKILIVDDEPVNIRLLTNALEESYQIYSAQNGPDAISLMKEQLPDLVLLDVIMSGMDGLEVCRRIRAEDSIADTPIIFITAINSREGEAQGLLLGAVDYLTKPLNIELAKLRIRNQLDMKRNMNIIKEQNALLNLQKRELEATLGRIRRLEGIIAICAYCKKIRDEDNVWQQIEQYIREHSDAVFSHGICPTCMEKEMKEITA